MGDTISLYEKQKAIDDARAREEAQKQAEEDVYKRQVLYLISPSLSRPGPSYFMARG